MTAIAIPAGGARSLPASGGVDRAIRVSTAAVVLAVAGIAAYISYWHAYAVVREYGESGVTALLEPATIDGLVYASSMVILYAARHRLPVPGLARWMLALGIAASLAVNVAQGWSHGLVGAVVAAWPAVALVGSYELLAWMIRTAAGSGPNRIPTVDQRVPQADQSGTRLRPAAPPVRQAGSAGVPGCGGTACEGVHDPRPASRAAVPVRGPGSDGPDHMDQRDDAAGPAWNALDRVDRVGSTGPVNTVAPVRDVDAAAVAAYRASVREGRPLSERKLAESFGRTSRRWARNRMAEARQSPVLA
jgi:nitrate reductase NapE component